MKAAPSCTFADEAEASNEEMMTRIIYISPACWEKILLFKGFGIWNLFGNLKS